MFDYKGKVAVVTGAAGNLGRAAAEELRASGARLALVDRAVDRFQPPLTGGDDILLLGTDLSDAGSVEAAIARVVAHYGRIDLLANIAGGFTMGPTVHETPLETWDFMLNLNLRSVILTCRAVLPHMRAARHGRIVNVSARAALEPKSNMAPYRLSKAAVITLTESIAAENREFGITANCILPGTIDTPQNRADMPDADFSRWVSPQALANVLLFLGSDEAAAVSGAAIPVYGRS